MRKQLLASSAALALFAASAGGVIPQTVSAGTNVANQSQDSSNKQTPAPVEQKRTTRRVRALTGGYMATRGDFRRAGPGWSNRQVQRMATKARNVKRSRASGRK